MGRTTITSILGMMAIIVSIVICAGVFTDKESSRPPPRQPAPTVSPETIQKLEQAIEALKDIRISGVPVLHSVDVENGIVRFHLVFWLLLPLEDKQGTVRLFSAYFKAKGKSGRVEILTDRNDRKLATYDVWHGIRILA